jgi:hypothetical protein
MSARQKIKFIPFQHEPDGNGDRMLGLPADHTDLDLSVVGEVVLQIVILRHWN